MKWLFLILLVACSATQDKKAAEVSEASEATESEAKPVSPYTVKDCYCMKIFQPVCAGGKNYGNSCEAECHGHKTWTEGHCGKSKK